MVEWNKVKTEYIAGGTSYRKLAAKYGVSRSKLQAKATKEKWAELKSQAKAKTESKIVESVSDRAADQAVSIIDVADKLLSKICEFLDADVYNTQNIKNLTSALKDLKEIKGFKSELDLQEQMARIAKLQREAEKEDNTETEIKVTFGAEDKECKKWAE